MSDYGDERERPDGDRVVPLPTRPSPAVEVPREVWYAPDWEPTLDNVAAAAAQRLAGKFRFRPPGQSRRQRWERSEDGQRWIPDSLDGIGDGIRDLVREIAKGKNLQRETRDALIDHTTIEEINQRLRVRLLKDGEHYSGPVTDDTDHAELTVEAWRCRQLPERDYLLESMMCTTSRWIIIGETGVGKTLLGLELGFAVSAGSNFLNWKGVRSARVLYLDGEMPAETFKERVEAAAAIYGNVNLVGYNRDVIKDHEMPPLNTAEGQVWLWRKIKEIKPDLIIFDSIMCLLVGPLSEEETWAPMTPLMRQISSQRIAQIWLHHTGHDTSKGFGTKTKEWQADTVAMLTKQQSETDSGDLTLEFRKARLRTPKNAALFKPQVIRRDEDGWISGGAAKTGKPKNAAARKQAWFRQIYFELAITVPATPGHTNAPVRKVALDAIRRGMVARGFLAKEEGKVTDAERKAFQRAKEELIASGKFTATDLHFWEVPA